MNPEQFSVDQIVEVFRSGDAEEKVAFVEACALTQWSDEAMMGAKSGLPEMRPQALEFLANGCARDGRFELGGKVAEASYRLAKEAYSEGPGDPDTYRMIAGRVAATWMDAFLSVGIHREVITRIDEPIKWLEEIGDRDNLGALRLKRINAYLNLEEYDEAEKALNKIDEASLPTLVQTTYRALRHTIEQRKGKNGDDAGRLPDEIEPVGRGDLMKILGGLLSDGAAGTDTASPPSLDYSKGLKDVAGLMTEGMFGGSDNEFTVRQRIIDASYLFTDEEKGHDPDEIEKIIRILIDGKTWMKEHNLPDDENFASWSLYISYNRTDRPGLAADQLLRIRSNIEKARSNIAEPMERARLTERYPFLYSALCNTLYRTGRIQDLFESIEASKGRVLADLLTLKSDCPADETAFAEAVRALPGLMNRLGSHYLTTFVDAGEAGSSVPNKKQGAPSGIYCVLVTRDGVLHGHFVEIEKERLAELAAIRDPSLWGKKDPIDLLGPRVPSDVPNQLAPLVDWLRPLFDDGVLKSGDHICYSPHDTLLSIPFHYIDFGGEPLVATFSMSRVHGAHALVETLRDEPRVPSSFFAVHVPSLQDQADKEKLAAFERPVSWLRSNMDAGTVLGNEQADIQHLTAAPLQGRVIHLATHGTFPETDADDRDPNPYRSAGVVLAAGGQLPDLAKVVQGQADENLLSPQKAIELGLDCSGSHITLQACVSGLAKRGFGGAALGPEWAFLQLGATSLLSTHWNTSARTTTEFVERFYQRWLKNGEPRSSAWRNTVLELRGNQETSDPYHWAAFSLSGDWR